MATATSSYLARKTPGVYITETPADVGKTLQPVPTAIPVFIGYTEFAVNPTTRSPLYNQPVAIESMADYALYFGGPAPLGYAIAEVAADAPASPLPGATGFKADRAKDGATTMAMFALTPRGGWFTLYWQMRLFFANGGGTCYVVSVGSYWDGRWPVAKPDLTVGDWRPGTIQPGDPEAPFTADGMPGKPGLLWGLNAAGYQVGPTMTVIPEACQLSADDYQAVTAAMIAQAAKLQDRMAIIDLPDCLTAQTVAALDAGRAILAPVIAPIVASARYGAAYAPAVRSLICGPDDIAFTALTMPDGDNATMNAILTTQAKAIHAGGALAAVQGMIVATFPVAAATAAADPDAFSVAVPAEAMPRRDPAISAAGWDSRLGAQLAEQLPIYTQILHAIAARVNIASPGSLMAGLWAQHDATAGVWAAPGNLPAQAVDGPLCDTHESEQDDFAAPANGQSVNLLRRRADGATGPMTVRTLDGYGPDFARINIRRLTTYIEQSVKQFLQGYAFEVNNAATWATVTEQLTAFLTDLWQKGGLKGRSAADAFTVQCGLGQTMTGQDILNGYMIIAMNLRVSEPAKFIELTFTQSMQGIDDGVAAAAPVPAPPAPAPSA